MLEVAGAPHLETAEEVAPGTLLRNVLLVAAVLRLVKKCKGVANMLQGIVLFTLLRLSVGND